MDENGDETFHELHFYYDALSRLVFVEFEGEKYSYIHNLQGDIVSIVDAAGNTVVKYHYDVWGRTISVDGTSDTLLSILNPFRYRGYVWDEDESLYYLRSRFYNPEMSRFASPDMVAAEETELISAIRNLYTYCYNEANNHADDDGALGFFATLALGGLINVAASAFGSVVNKKSYGLKDAARDFGMGMITTFAGMMGGICGRVVSGIAAAAVEGVTYMFEVDQDEYSNKECALRMMYGFVSTAAAPQLEASYVDELMGIESYRSEAIDWVYSSVSSSVGAYYNDQREKHQDKKSKKWTDGSDYVIKKRYDPLTGKDREIVVFV